MAKRQGETALDKLLATLTFTLHATTFVFVTARSDGHLPPLDEVQLLFRETEGVTAVVSQEYATAHSIGYSFPSKMITLDVVSSLEAVGFMAVISNRLAAEGISTNPVSGFYHDHLFVPLGREADALRALEALARENRSE